MTSALATLSDVRYIYTTAGLRVEVFYVRYFVAGFSIKPRKAFKQHNKILLDIVHGKLNLNLISLYALSTCSLCRTEITHDT